MNFKFDIDSDDFVKFTNNLEKIHQSALPNAVRGTLNSLAFDVKQRTMPKSAEKSFVNRRKSFFKANSTVVKASGFNIERMESVVGFRATGRTKNNKAVKELEQQEFGGIIKDRNLIPLMKARTGNRAEKNVRKRDRLAVLPKHIKNNPRVFDVTKNNSKSKKQRYVRTVLLAKKSKFSDVYILGNKYKGGIQTLSRIDSIYSNIKTRKLIIKRTPLYSFKKGRVVEVKSKNFMKRASFESGLKASEFYRKEAERQFERVLRK